MVQAAARPDTGDMVLIHRVFRREFRLLPAMVRAVPLGDLARAKRVATHAVEYVGALHHHHAGEDDLLWPRLRARAAPNADVVRRMEAQHAQVAALLARADVLVPAWSADAEAAVRDELADVLGQTSAVLDTHLDEEERTVLPLAEQHLTVDEWAELGERGAASMPMRRGLVFLGHILEEASPRERAAFLARLPLPARLAYRIAGARMHRREVADLRQGLPRQRSG